MSTPGQESACLQYTYTAGVVRPHIGTSEQASKAAVLTHRVPGAADVRHGPQLCSLAPRAAGAGWCSALPHGLQLHKHARGVNRRLLEGQALQQRPAGLKRWVRSPDNQCICYTCRRCSLRSPSPDTPSRRRKIRTGVEDQQSPNCSVPSVATLEDSA